MAMEQVDLNTIQMKFRRQIDAGGINLLFELEIEPEELQYIRDSGEKLIAQALNGNYAYDLCVAYYLMDVGRRFYKDGNYWSDVDTNVNHQKKIGDFFFSTIKGRNLFWYNFGRINVSNILMHSFIPEQYSDSFFDFVNRFYAVALNSQVPDDIDEKLQKFAEVFSSEDFSEVFQEFRSFKPIVSTRRVLTDATYFGPIVKKMIRRIANDYDNVEDVNLGVYEEPFKRWLSMLGSDKGKKITLNESPYLQFNVERSIFRIVIPQRRVASTYSAFVFRDSYGNQIKRYSFRPTNQFDTYISPPIEDEFKHNPLEPFTISLGNSIVYSNDNFGHLLLNKHGKRRRKLSLGTNMLVLPNGEGINLMYEPLAVFAEYKVIHFLALEGQRLEVMGKTYVIEKEVTDNVHIISPIVDVECRDQDGNRYDVYRSLPTINISPEQGRSRFQFAVTHGIDRLVYTDYSTLSRDSVAKPAEYGVNLDLASSSLENRDGIYTIRSRNRDVDRFVVLKNLYFQFDQAEYKVNGRSKMSCNYLQEDIEFDTEQGVVTFDMPMDGRILTITIQIPSNRYSFDKVHWKFFDSEEIYFRTLVHPRIYIYCPTPTLPTIMPQMVDSKPLNLDIEDKYLVAEMGRINQIGYLIEYGNRYIPKLDFRCGRFKLFTIRYYASYDRQDNVISRHDAPPCTYGKLIVPGMDPIRFDDSVSIPNVYGCKMEIDECYDDGLSGEMPFKATWVDREFHLSCDRQLIIHGNRINKFPYRCDGVDHEYSGNPFYYLYGAEGPEPNPFALEMDRKALVGLDAAAFPYLLEEVKTEVLKDRDAKRVLARMKRLAKVDREFAINLGEHFVKDNFSGLVEEELRNLMKMN